jgi:diaminopimelate decarboxylase
LGRNLFIGGCNTTELATAFGTPLYIFDEVALRHKCQEYQSEFQECYPDIKVIYASKAFINPALAVIFKEEGLGLDVVSAGELSIAKSAGVPPEQVYFHGNNKTEEEITSALEYQGAKIVVDNFDELSLLGKLAQKRGGVVDILLRLSPDIDPHTHRYIATGMLDSKFGFPIVTGEEAVAQAIDNPHFNLLGFHFHIGSLIFELEPYTKAIEIVIQFAARLINFQLKELDIGGGFAVQYTLDTPPPMASDYARAIATALVEQCRRARMLLPQLVIEPGRAIIAQSGVALYQVGATKDIPGIRRYVFVDGGIGDNIRPALYGSRYEALSANKADEPNSEKVTIAGKFCESGDILVKDIQLPRLEAGDLIAIPDCGAYSLPMSSNYNISLRPAVVLVKDGQARLIRRRETYQDILKIEVI